GRGAANDADIDWERTIEKEFFAIDLKQADEIVLGAFIDFSAAVTRVGECSEAHTREMAGPFGSNVPEEMRNHALRKVVCFYPVRDSKLLQFGDEPPVPADNATHQPLVAEVVKPTLLAVALARRVDEGKISRLVARWDIFRPVLRLQRYGNFLRKADAHEASGRDRVTFANETHRLLGGNNLSTV